MTYYPDLSRYEYSDSERTMLNVGWLDRSSRFPTVKVSDVFIRGLVLTRTNARSLGFDVGSHVWLAPVEGANSVPDLRKQPAAS